MTAEPIARVVADLKAGRARNALPGDPELYQRALRRCQQPDLTVVDATAIYHSLLNVNRPVYLYEDHPCIAPPWRDAAVCYTNEHGNVLVMQLSADEIPKADRRELWPAAPFLDRHKVPEHKLAQLRTLDEPIDWSRVRWVIDTFVWLGGRSGELGGSFPTSGPVHLWRFAVYETGEPADLRWVLLIPDYPQEHWDMAHLVLLGALNFMNCFAAETPIITNEGIAPIGKLAGREVEVLTREAGAHAAARFAPARIERFGRQPIVELDVRRNGVKRTYRTTAGHRWFIRRRAKDGPRSTNISEAATSELRPGDRLVTVRLKAEPNHWQVVAVRSTEAVEEVFCAVVPGTETFVLDGMVLTGNCRNVELVEPTRERHQRKRLARLGVTVRTINVFPTTRATHSGTRPPGAGGSVPLTTVIGHFAHYGPQYGRGLLFGKLAGRYWIPQYAYGDAEHGRVQHDYRLRP